MIISFGNNFFILMLYSTQGFPTPDFDALPPYKFQKPSIYCIIYEQKCIPTFTIIIFQNNDEYNIFIIKCNDNLFSLNVVLSSPKFRHFWLNPNSISTIKQSRKIIFFKELMIVYIKLIFFVYKIQIPRKGVKTSKISFCFNAFYQIKT